MKQTFLSAPVDMKWLFDTHLKSKQELRKEYKSAMIYGNEDCPERVELYKKKNPLVTDTPLELTLNGETGEYI